MTEYSDCLFPNLKHFVLNKCIRNNCYLDASTKKPKSFILLTWLLSEKLTIPHTCSFRLYLTNHPLLLFYPLSPSGCTFWGKKPWSRKKKILWQLGTLVGAPVGIALIAGIAIPAMIIGIPVYVGRKVRANIRAVKRWMETQTEWMTSNVRVHLQVHVPDQCV